MTDLTPATESTDSPAAMPSSDSALPVVPESSVPEESPRWRIPHNLVVEDAVYAATKEIRSVLAEVKAEASGVLSVLHDLSAVATALEQRVTAAVGLAMQDVLLRLETKLDAHVEKLRSVVQDTTPAPSAEQPAPAIAVTLESSPAPSSSTETTTPAASIDTTMPSIDTTTPAPSSSEPEPEPAIDLAPKQPALRQQP